MGGPCILIEDGGQHTAPPCTDNFQVRPFIFDGQEWQSVEQCFQGLKFMDREVRERIRAIRKESEHTDASHGLLVWQAGQCQAELRPDWDATKIEIMYRMSFAKYAQHRDLQDELLSTGTTEIVGGPSTSWTTKSGKQTNWGEWNGRIQMLIREMLRPPADRMAPQSTSTDFEEYMSDQGGKVLPLPGYTSCESASEFSEATAKCWLETFVHAGCIDAQGTPWQRWVGDDQKRVAATLLILGLDDGRYSSLVSGFFERLLTAEGGISIDAMNDCLAEYDEEVLEDLALDNPKSVGMMSRIRAALASVRTE